VFIPKETVTDRETLYRRVWETPMRHLAKEFGISDVGLAKICKAHSIPKPGLGYWAKRAHGKAPRKRKLPTGHDNLSICIRSSPPKLGSDLEIQTIVVAAELTDPHHLVSAAKKSMSRRKRDESGVITPKAPRRLDISVTPEQLDRALRVMDALVKALQAMKWPISLVKVEERVEVSGRPYFVDHARELPPERYKTCVRVNGEQMEISLSEKWKQVPFDPEDRKRRGLYERHWYFNPPKYDLVPSGRLVLKIENASSTGVRQNWRDTEKSRLEDKLGQFLTGLDVASKTLRLEREERRRAEEQRQIAMARQRDLEERRVYEQKLVEDLEEMATNWDRANRIGEFLMAVGDAFPEESRSPRVTAWLDWATRYVRRLDPLSAPDSVPKLLEPDRLPNEAVSTSL